MRLLGILVAGSLLCSSAHAEFFQGNNIYKYCTSDRAIVVKYAAGAIDKSTKDFASIGLFWSHLFKAVEQEKLDSAMQEAKGAVRGYCEPNGVNLAQAADVFCKYLKDNPADRHKAASELLDIALSEAWPCK
jgi:hypothetical protein